MGVQDPEKKQALEIAASVMTLSREQTVQQFYLSEASFPRVVLFHQKPVLATVTQGPHKTASKLSHGSSCSAKPPFLPAPLQEQQLPLPGLPRQ